MKIRRLMIGVAVLALLCAAIASHGYRHRTINGSLYAGVRTARHGFGFSFRPRIGGAVGFWRTECCDLDARFTVAVGYDARTGRVIVSR